MPSSLRAQLEAARPDESGWKPFLRAQQAIVAEIEIVEREV
jgi:hypothetical protein